MISPKMEGLYPSAKALLEERIASRLFAKDASVFAFDGTGCSCAEKFMGWTDLASNPPVPLDTIQEFAREQIARGIEAIVLVGQGGSTQAAMTITKYNKIDANAVAFRTIDSVSPVRLREFLALADPKKTLAIIASKSGNTLEPSVILKALRKAFSESMPEDELVKHFIAVTDPGSPLVQQAEEEGWLAVFNGEPTIGGRYSALSVFGLLPAALVGIDLKAFMANALEAERICSEDSPDNPAIALAAFLYDNYLAGRDKFSLLTQKRGRVLGLWIEQLVAESLGKAGKGILPNIEVDSLMLKRDPGDRTVIMYETKTDLWDELRNFEMSLAYVDPAIPRLNYKINSVVELAGHFVMWEYAIAMCGYLMRVCPFDQPDVSASKAKVRSIIAEGLPEPDISEPFLGDVNMGIAEMRVSPCFADCTDIRSALKALFASVEPGDFFALNAFLPFTGEGRREALEFIRHEVAAKQGIASCLEVGPRYLHSTGQFHKGGPNKGVFLVLSADELKDVPVDDPVGSLGSLAKAQAVGDMLTLAEQGRRCIHLHLPDNSGATLRHLSFAIALILTELQEERRAEQKAQPQASDDVRAESQPEPSSHA